MLVVADWHSYSMTYAAAKLVQLWSANPVLFMTAQFAAVPLSGWPGAQRVGLTERPVSGPAVQIHDPSFCASLAAIQNVKLKVLLRKSYSS
jgi:hypothetical protein